MVCQVKETVLTWSPNWLPPATRFQSESGHNKIFKMPSTSTKQKTCMRAFSWEISELWGQREDSACFEEENQVTHTKKQEKKNRIQMVLDFSAAILKAR